MSEGRARKSFFLCSREGQEVICPVPNGGTRRTYFPVSEGGTSMFPFCACALEEYNVSFYFVRGRNKKVHFSSVGEKDKKVPVHYERVRDK